MKHIVFLFSFLFFSIIGIVWANDIDTLNLKEPTSNISSFKPNEFLKYKVSYSKFLSAGYATLNLKEVKDKNGKKLYHSVGEGKTSGLIRFFFKVNDRFESYFDPKTNLPKKFIRKTNEGGYQKNRMIEFKQSDKKAKVFDYKRKSEQSFNLTDNVHDFLSSFYYLRNIDDSKIKVGNELIVKMFFDDEEYNMKLKFVSKEFIKTKFGRRECWKINPIVKAGRVFEQDNSLIIWITADENLVPVKVKSKLSVGSLNAELVEYKNLKKSLN